LGHFDEEIVPIKQEQARMWKKDVYYKLVGKNPKKYWTILQVTTALEEAGVSQI